MSILEARDLSFAYQVGGREVRVLKKLCFTVNAGDFVAIQGPSGSGKSTLFYILGLLLKPTSGKILFEGTDLSTLSEDEMAFFRNQKLGFVFQQFHLLAKATALDNILLPMRYPCETARIETAHRARAQALAERLGISNHLRNLPNQLSGGQQQRVAIARALMREDVRLILADEPTGNLDSRAAEETMSLLQELNRQGKTIVLITHDGEVAKRCSKVYHLRDGAFTHEENIRVDTDTDTGTDTATDHRSPHTAHRPLSLTSSLPRVPATSPSLYVKLSRAALPLVRESLARNKTKSLLTMMGVIIGVAAVLAMVTLGQFTKKKVLESYEALGVNNLMVRGYPNWDRKATDAVSVNFTEFEWEKDFQPLKRIFPEIYLGSPVLNSWQNSVTAGGLNVSDKVTVFGVNAAYLTITNRKLRLGHGFSPYHIESRSPVCVIGFEIAERLFAHVNPVGQIVSVGAGQTAYPCQVIGVLAPISKASEWSPPNRQVFIPYTYFQATVTEQWYRHVHEINLMIRPDGDVETAGKKVAAFFRKKYGKSGVFSADSDSTLVAQMKRFLNLFGVLLTAIALLSLLVGGIGINNMMLVSVAERLKELGLRKALGATNRSIRVQVLLEAVVLCTAAGVIGATLGFVGYELLIFGATKFVAGLKFEWVLDPWALVLSMVSIVGVGLASGLVPALRAERLQVIEALRAE